MKTWDCKFLEFLPGLSAKSHLLEELKKYLCNISFSNFFLS